MFHIFSYFFVSFFSEDVDWDEDDLVAVLLFFLLFALVLGVDLRFRVDDPESDFVSVLSDVAPPLLPLVAVFFGSLLFIFLLLESNVNLNARMQKLFVAGSRLPAGGFFFRYKLAIFIKFSRA